MKREINLLNKILLFKSIFVDNVRQKFIVTYKEARIAYNTTKHQQWYDNYVQEISTLNSSQSVYSSQFGHIP